MRPPDFTCLIFRTWNSALWMERHWKPGHRYNVAIDTANCLWIFHHSVHWPHSKWVRHAAAHLFSRDVIQIFLLFFCEKHRAHCSYWWRWAFFVLLWNPVLSQSFPSLCNHWTWIPGMMVDDGWTWTWWLVSRITGKTTGWIPTKLCGGMGLRGTHEI